MKQISKPRAWAMLCIALLISHSFFLCAQVSFTQSVIASTGNFSSAGGNSFSSTTGEMMTKTRTASIVFTEGFQQPSLNTCVCSAAPAKPGTISVSGGITKICPGDVRTYTVINTNCVTYNWTTPAGATILSGQGSHSISVQFDNSFGSSGVLSVMGSNSCGNSAARTLTILHNTAAPATPGVLSGNYGLCGFGTATISVQNVSGNTYNWWLDASPPNITGGQGSNAVTLDMTGWSGSANNINVTATNGCGFSSAVRKGPLKNIPATPGTIAGTTSVCSFQTFSYSIASVPNASTYYWYAPIGSTITDGVNSVTVTTATTAFITTSVSVSVTYPNMSAFTAQQYVKVKAHNSCGFSGLKMLKVYGTCGAKTDDELVAESSDARIEMIRVYPNPSSGHFQFEVQNFTGAEMQVSVFNLLGERVMRSIQLTSDGSGQIDLSEQLSGFYVLHIQSDGEARTAKLQVIR